MWRTGFPTHFYTTQAASHAYGGPMQGFGVWAIERMGTRDIIGTCGFWQGNGWPRELTWWLLPVARGQGYALEASRAAVAHAYTSFG